MSRWARDVFNFSLGVWFSPDSSANIFILSLNGRFSGSLSPVFCCCCCCCFSCSRRVRGSLENYTITKHQRIVELVKLCVDNLAFSSGIWLMSCVPVDFLSSDNAGRLLNSCIPWFAVWSGWCQQQRRCFSNEFLPSANILRNIHCKWNV